mmetsp:Transcript_101262/g.307281  ORF Transcript_101262/g.307281 Transcript_101262/m.307281 type:complete len:149 (-) Transcript_101262:776-1222(-)
MRTAVEASVILARVGRVPLNFTDAEAPEPASSGSNDTYPIRVRVAAKSRWPLRALLSEACAARGKGGMRVHAATCISECRTGSAQSPGGGAPVPTRSRAAAGSWVLHSRCTSVGRRATTWPAHVDEGTGVALLCSAVAEQHLHCAPFH